MPIWLKLWISAWALAWPIFAASGCISAYYADWRWRDHAAKALAEMIYSVATAIFQGSAIFLLGSICCALVAAVLLLVWK